MVEGIAMRTGFAGVRVIEVDGTLEIWRGKTLYAVASTAAEATALARTSATFYAERPRVERPRGKPAQLADRSR